MPKLAEGPFLQVFASASEGKPLSFEQNEILRLKEEKKANQSIKYETLGEYFFSITQIYGAPYIRQQ